MSTRTEKLLTCSPAFVYYMDDFCRFAGIIWDVDANQQGVAGRGRARIDLMSVLGYGGAWSVPMVANVSGEPRWFEIQRNVAREQQRFAAQDARALPRAQVNSIRAFYRSLRNDLRDYARAPSNPPAA